MTLWQSIGLISPAQWAYAAALAGLFAWRGPSPILWVLVADYVAMLAIFAAMDFGLLAREPGNDEVSWAFLVLWVATVAYLATIPGAGRVMALVGFLTIAFFLAALRFQFQFLATSAIVNAGAFIMLAVAAYGMGNGGGAGRGHSDRPLPLGLSAGDHQLGAGGLAHGAGLLSQDRRGLK